MEFGIHQVEQLSPCIIIGRCYKGRINIGDTFNKFVGQSSDAYNVIIEVFKIEAYNNSLNEIEEGMTARLFLKGIGVDFLADEGILYGN